MTRWVGVLLAVALWGWGRAAQAQTTMGFIISGDCRDPDLSQNARQLARELKAKLGDRLLTDDALRARLSPQPAVNAEDLGRQLDAAETLFYNGEHTKSEAAILHALEDIRRFPPGPERWKLAVKAELLESQVIRRLGRGPEADDLFRHVLRLQPAYQLDPDYFMPSIRQRFERLRKELQASRRVRVEVKSIPAGAEIFLDGVRQGATPAALEVWPGDYELIVAREGQRSLPHQLTARRENGLPNAVLVDLQFEGAIQLDRDPCFATRAGDERSRLAGALKIATLLGVDSMVALHLIRAATGPASLAATVLDTQTGQKLRYGEIKLQAGPQQPSPAAVLARFVLTGEHGKQLMAVDVAPPPPAPAKPVAAAPSVPAPPHAVPAVWGTSAVRARPPPAPQAPPGDWLPKGWRGEAVLGLGGSGAAVLVAGGVLVVLGNGTMADANRYFEGTVPSQSQLQALAQLQDTARVEQGIGVAGLVAGGLAMAVAGVLLQVDPSGSAPEPGGITTVSVGASSSGAAVQLGGTF